MNLDDLNFFKYHEFLNKLELKEIEESLNLKGLDDVLLNTNSFKNGDDQFYKKKEAIEKLLFKLE